MNEIIIIRESLLQSITSDAVTYGGLLACLYVSERTGSVFFTVLLAGVFLLLISRFPDVKTKHKTVEGAIKHLNELKHNNNRIQAEPPEPAKGD